MILQVVTGALMFMVSNGYHLPNPLYTPGAVTSMDRGQICSKKWGLDRRFVTLQMKKHVCLLYGITQGCPGPKWEVDHLIPRSWGGADDIRNISPQPITEARIKDRIEVWGDKQICLGILDLKKAQTQIATDWTYYLGSIGR